MKPKKKREKMVAVRNGLCTGFTKEKKVKQNKIHKKKEKKEKKLLNVKYGGEKICPSEDIPALS